MLREGQALHDTEDDLAKDDDHEEPEALDQGFRRCEVQVPAHQGTPHEQQQDHHPDDGETCPNDKPWLDWQECAREDRRGGHARARHVAPRDRQEFGSLPTILTLDRVRATS